MTRALLLVLDSVGIGGAPDAAAFGDEGANTLGHIVEACESGLADRPSLRHGPLQIPNLVDMGIGSALQLVCGESFGLGPCRNGAWGAATESSSGKDTTSGHWELTGAPVMEPWTTFPDETPAFPDWLLEGLVAEAGLTGTLGNCRASGTEIIEWLGEKHLSCGQPIVYTSADSVVQIAAHEDTYGLDRLYSDCEIVRKLVDPINVGRVIARPFVGQPGRFRRTANRRDYSVPPKSETLLDRLEAAGHPIMTLGKIGDIFAHRATGDERKAAGNMALFDLMLDSLPDLPGNGFLFANFVDFDSEFGHRRNVAGYADALEAFDARLPELLERLAPDDLLIITADHGNDPTWAGTDHTREMVPVLCRTGRQTGVSLLGRRKFVDVGATLAQWLGLAGNGPGTSFLNRVSSDAPS